MRRVLLLLIAGLFLIMGVVSGTVLADEYVLVMSKKDKLCQHMLSIYNSDLKKFGNIEHDKHEEFTNIKWQEKKLICIYDGKEIEGSVNLSLIDINNDGQKEVVLKSSGHIGYVLTEDIRVFKSSDFDMQKKYFNAQFLNSKFLVKVGGFEKNEYYLKEMPAQEIFPPDRLYKGYTRYCSLTGGYVNPFIFEENAFVEMEGTYLSEDDAFKDWLVILEVTPENKLLDTCYCLKLKGTKEEQDSDNITGEGEK